MSDFFNEAYRHARSRFTSEQWLVLAPQQVTRAIYDAMRELDAVRVSQASPPAARKAAGGKPQGRVGRTIARQERAGD
jgi:hypothetical protein